MTPTVSGSDTLQAAIHALYGPDPVAQGQANSWLQAFSGTDEAWHAALQLLQPAFASEVQFFACNMLLSKIRSSWGRLSSENKAGLFSTLT